MYSVDVVLRRLGDVDKFCDIGLSRTTPGDDLRGIAPVPLFNGRDQRRIRIQSLQYAMESDSGSETTLEDDPRKIPPVP